MVCHPGTQHAGRLAAALQHEAMLGRFFTGFRVRPDSMLGRRLRLSGLRALDESLTDCTTQIRSPELFAKLAQCLGSRGERLMRIRNGWFQRLIPRAAIASSDAVIGFDTASWVLAKRAREFRKPFVLDRAAVHRSTRASIRAEFRHSGLGQEASESRPGDIQDEIETEEMARSTRIVVASRFSERSVVNAGFSAGKVTVIPYGVNWSWFAEGGDRDGAGGKMVFLFVGILKNEKGVGVMVEAWKQLRAPDAELWLAGGGDDAVIEAARAVPGVRVLGKLGPDELRKAYRDASVFVFPTFYDGFGMVLLEAMSSGLPVIATPNCAAPDLIQNGAAGVVFPAGDPAALCSAMADACANRAAWAGRGMAAREIAKAHTWEAYGKRWATLLREVVR